MDRKRALGADLGLGDALTACAVHARGVLAFALACSACGGRQLEPPELRQPASELKSVPYPPPPARVEVVTAPARTDCVWVDGYWDYNRQSWQWQSGDWVVPGPSCRLAPMELRREAGRLLHAPPRWYARAPQGRHSACPRPPVCRARGSQPR